MGLGMQFRTRLKKVILRNPLLHELILKFSSRREIFSRAYALKRWGSDESGSGTGSELGATEELRRYLPDLLMRLGVVKFLDAPCGDWNWMRHVDLTGIEYLGVDVVPEVIARNRAAHERPGVKFLIADATKDPLPRADLILCRDCWVHLSFLDCASMLENFRRSGATWLLISNSPGMAENTDQLTGWTWRKLNLQRPPFNFPPGIESRRDNYEQFGFEITLWRIADLPRIDNIMSSSGNRSPRRDRMVKYQANSAKEPAKSPR